MELTLGDFGTSYSKIKRGGHVEVIPSSDLAKSEFMVDVGTGHNAGLYARRTVNELVALSRGAQSSIDEDDFVVLDVGSRDIKYVRIRGGRFYDGDWNTICGAMAGLTLELLLRHLSVNPSELRVSDTDLGVTCGILGTGAVFDLIAEGLPPEAAVSALIRGIAQNTYSFCKRPDKIYLSGGLCNMQAFIDSFPCEVVPMGRFVLIEGLSASISD
ncbi:MAG: ATPase [Candidatus Aquicultor sp.]